MTVVEFVYLVTVRMFPAHAADLDTLRIHYHLNLTFLIDKTSLKADCTLVTFRNQK